MRTQPEPTTLQRKWWQTISYLGKTTGRSKLEKKAGLSLILCCLQSNTIMLSSPISVQYLWRPLEDTYKYWILLRRENPLKKAQFPKQLWISAIHFLCYRVPYGVSRAAFYRKFCHKESSHSFRSQPVVAVFFHHTCSRPKSSDSRQLCQET